MSSARVSTPTNGAPAVRGLSAQEKDLLDRSTRKPKVVEKCFLGGGFQTTIDLSREEGDNSREEAYTGFMDPLCPVVRLSEVERTAIRIPWKRSLIVKVLGKRVSLRYFQTRFYKLWQLRARMEVIDLDNEYFVIRFENVDDMQHVFDDGPWMLSDHYIVTHSDGNRFTPFDDDLRRVAVWVRVPRLPIEFYDKRVLWRIGNVLGKTVKIDNNTLQEREGPHGKVAQVNHGSISNKPNENGSYKELVVDPRSISSERPTGSWSMGEESVNGSLARPPETSPEMIALSTDVVVFNQRPPDSVERVQSVDASCPALDCMGITHNMEYVANEEAPLGDKGDVRSD
ncbi:hypothetical protein SESBI_16954 [Sesbania bispinosa]|nr:hypothetical protein SESBI_16954 [Sesbania bispinosa]